TGERLLLHSFPGRERERSEVIRGIGVTAEAVPFEDLRDVAGHEISGGGVAVGAGASQEQQRAPRAGEQAGEERRSVAARGSCVCWDGRGHGDSRRGRGWCVGARGDGLGKIGGGGGSVTASGRSGGFSGRGTPVMS